MEDNTDKKQKRPFLVKLADRLVKDQQELDELAVQLALGKAEAGDKFEKAKKQLNKRVHKVTTAISSEFEDGKEWVQSLKGKLSNLTGNLTQGKVENAEMFNEQRKTILQGLDEVEQEIDKSPDASKLSRSFQLASEKIKLQMELFEKKLASGKKELTTEFHEEMGEARQKMHAIAAKLREKKEDVDDKLDDLKEDMRDSYDHLKKAIKSW